MRSNASGSDQKMIQLQDEIEELTVWKDKVQTSDLGAGGGGSDQKMIKLQDEIEELTVWKDKVQTSVLGAVWGVVIRR